MRLDVDGLRGRLEDERTRLLAALDGLNHDRSLNEETGDLASGPGDHLADHATETYIRELDGGLEDNAEHLLAEIDGALRRIEDGTYGTCVACGRPIAPERLEAVPWATLCIDDQRAREQR